MADGLVFTIPSDSAKQVTDRTIPYGSQVIVLSPVSLGQNQRGAWITFR
jgi:hypothetical protein